MRMLGEVAFELATLSRAECPGVRGNVETATKCQHWLSAVEIKLKPRQHSGDN